MTDNEMPVDDATKRKLQHAFDPIFVERTPVESRVLASVGYHEPSESLVVEFPNGRVYVYDEVPKAAYDGLMAAPSKGTFFGRAIRGKFHGQQRADVKRCDQCGDIGIDGTVCLDCGCGTYKEPR